MRALRLVVVFVFFCVLFCGPARLRAQTQTGTVSGTVTDTSGAVVSGAKVVLKNAETGQSREVVVNDQGVFYFDKVWPGNYRVTITKDGFRTFVVASLDVFVGKGTDIGTPRWR